MKTVEDYSAEAWAQEQRRHSEYMTRQIMAKKLEDAIEEALPKDLIDYRMERNLDHPKFAVVVSVTDAEETLRFTFDDKGTLVLIGKCADSNRLARTLRHLKQHESQLYKAIAAAS